MRRGRGVVDFFVRLLLVGGDGVVIFDAGGAVDRQGERVALAVPGVAQGRCSGLFPHHFQGPAQVSGAADEFGPRVERAPKFSCHCAGCIGTPGGSSSRKALHGPYEEQPRDRQSGPAGRPVARPVARGKRTRLRRLRVGLLPQVQVAAQPYTRFARLVGRAVRRRNRPPCGGQLLDGERGLVMGGRDLHHRKSRLRHVCAVDRPHTRHDAPALAGVLASGQRHPAGYGWTCVLTSRRVIARPDEAGASRSSPAAGAHGRARA